MAGEAVTTACGLQATASVADGAVVPIGTTRSRATRQRVIVESRAAEADPYGFSEGLRIESMLVVDDRTPEQADMPLRPIPAGAA